MRAISSVCATMPAPRPASSLSTRSKTSTVEPRRIQHDCSQKAAHRATDHERAALPCHAKESGRFVKLFQKPRRFSILRPESPEELRWLSPCSTSPPTAPTNRRGRPPSPPNSSVRSRIRNGCVGSTLLSEDDRVRVWIIRLAPAERIGFHRHVLDYFWTSASGGKGRQHLMDGTTVE